MSSDPTRIFSDAWNNSAFELGQNDDRWAIVEPHAVLSMANATPLHRNFELSDGEVDRSSYLRRRYNNLLNSNMSVQERLSALAAEHHGINATDTEALNSALDPYSEYGQL